MPEIPTPAEQRLETALRVFAAAFALAAVSYLVASFVRPWSAFVHHLPFVSSSTVKVALLGMCCLFASGDVRRRRGLVRIVIAGHVVSVAAMLGFLLCGVDVARDSGIGVSVGTVLWAAVALDGVILLILLALYLPASRAPARPPAGTGALTAEERRARTMLAVLALAFAAAAVLYAIGPFLAATTATFRELPFVSNSVVKAGVLAMLCFYAARNPEHDLAAVDIVFAAHVVSVLAMVAMLIGADTSATVSAGTVELSIRNVLWGAIALDAVIACWIVWWTLAAWRARFRLSFFRPIEFRSLVALADVLIAGDAETVPPDEIAQRADRYMAGIRARRRWLFRLALFGIQLHPLLKLRPPLSEMRAGQRRQHLTAHFGPELVRRQGPDWKKSILQVLIRIATQLAYVGYYSDPRTFGSVGYATFTERARAKGEAPPPATEVELDVLRGPEVGGPLRADVCIIGSGAAGAILAHELAAAGKDVLIVERGRFVRPADFSEDEVEMIGKLYADGMFQQSQDFRFTILQGSCVGGTTVVNNAVCFRPPEPVLQRWNDGGAGLDLDDLRRSTDHVWSWLRVGPQDHEFLNPSGKLFKAQLERSAREEYPSGMPVVDANIRECLGCGYCNIGCRYGRKLDMLDVVLPAAQKNGPGRMRIVSDCQVDRIRTRTGSPRRAHDASAVTADGRRLTVAAETFVVAAGTIASSHLLMRSGIGGKHVGKRLSFNMGSYLTADFEQEVRSHEGLQISHYAMPGPERGFVLETWWNPLVAQAINMPGWFEDHFANMQRYGHMMAVGVLVGTRSNGKVVPALTGGPDVSYRPAPEDMRKLGDGLKSAGRILLGAGAERVMANTWGYDTFRDARELERLDRIVADPRYITLGTGHPQGGNALSGGRDTGVVDPEFRVHGYDNLHVCDASVFPASVGVNPQITVMSLAHYASKRIS